MDKRAAELRLCFQQEVRFKSSKHHREEQPAEVWPDGQAGLNFNKDKQGKRQQVKDNNGEALPQVTILKGEKSFPVFITTFTVVNKETREKIKYDDYRLMSEERRKEYNVYPKLQVYNVFNVAQTNLQEARPELYKKQEAAAGVNRPLNQGDDFSFPAMDKMIKENGWICPIKPVYGDNAYYSISKNEIVIPEKRQFKDGESFYINLGHEMAHSTGSENHLGRLKPASFGNAEYAREELVAELRLRNTTKEMLLTSPKSISHQLNTVAMISLLRMSIMLWYIIRMLEAHTMWCAK